MSVAIDSRVDSVRLYRFGATVTRAARAQAAEGAVLVRFTGLPLALEDASVRLAVQGGGSFVDQRVTVERADGAADRAPATALDEARALEEAARAELAAVARQQETLGKLAVVRRAARPDEPTPPADPRARAALLAMQRTLLGELHAERARLARELDKLSKRRAALADAAARAAGATPIRPHELRKVVTATLFADAAGELPVELSYFVPGARWAPSYVLRLDESLRRATLEVRAVVAQSSGEDWSGVAISLSTADAKSFVELPELSSLRVGRAQAAKKPAPRPLELDASALFADYARAFGPDAAPPPPPKAAFVKEEDTPVEQGVLLDEVLASEPFFQNAPPQAGGPPGFGGPPRQAGPPRDAPAMAPMAPMAMAMPAPAMMQQTMAARAKGGLFSSFGGGGGGEQLKARLGRAEAPAAVAEPSIEIDERMFDLEALRLPPFEERAGKLRLASRGERYVADVTGLSVDALTQALEASLEESRRALKTKTPDRCVPPAPDAGFFDVLRGELRVDVPADGAYHGLPVLSGELAVTPRYVTVPREQADVFRVAVIENKLGTALLSGPCDVYVGRELLLTTALDGVPKGATLRLGLGVEQRVKVARNTRFAEATQGLMGGTLALKHQIGIEIASHLPVEAEIEVRERVPAAHESQEDIKIELGAVAPAWRPWEPPANEGTLRGAYAWTVRVPPGGRADLSAEYVIRIPSKLELVGGNRRD